MRHPTIFAKSALLFLLLVLCMSVPQVRAQNQTPSNVGPVVGAWTDPATGLTWTKSDNGSDVNWNQATDYCSNLRLGGYSDWRLPTIDELQGIYDSGIDVRGQWEGGTYIWHVKGNLQLSGWHWSSSQLNAANAWHIYYSFGGRGTYPLGYSKDGRALCVRRAGQ
jgi:hypothetical protein